MCAHGTHKRSFYFAYFAFFAANFYKPSVFICVHLWTQKTINQAR